MTEDGEDVKYPEPTEIVNPINTYELKLTILNINLIAVKISSTAITSSWFNIIAVTFGGLLIAGALGDKLVNLYNMVMK